MANRHSLLIIGTNISLEMPEHLYEIQVVSSVEAAQQMLLERPFQLVVLTIPSQENEDFLASLRQEEILVLEHYQSSDLLPKIQQFLAAKSEVSLNALASQFIKGLVSTGVGKASIIILGMAGLMITTRVLSPQEVGIFVLIQVVVVFLTEASNLGISSAISKFTASIDSHLEVRRLISTAIYFRLLTIVITACIFIGSASALLAFFGGDTNYDGFMLYIPLLIAIESLGKIIFAILQGSFKFRVIGITSILSSVLNFLLVILLVLIVDGGLTGLIFAKIISRFIAFVYACTKGNIRISPVFDWPLLKKMLVFGLPLEINYIQSFLYQRVDTFLIGMLLGTTDVAFYEIARRIPDSGMEGYDAFHQVYFPFISRLYDHREWDKLANVVNTATRWLTFGSLFAALVAFAFGEAIITTLFSETYQPSAPAFGLLMIGLMVIVLDSTLGYSLVAIGETTKPVVINMFRTFFSITAYLLLIPPYGIVGAAIANALAIALMNPLYIYYLRMKGVKVDVMAFVKPILIFGGFVLVLEMVMLPTLHRFVLILVYLVANVVFEVVSKDELALFWKSSKKFLLKGQRTWLGSANAG